MRAIMVMFDSLNRRMLRPYGCDWVRTDNFGRLAGRCATFDRSYVGSMPCMPARRELHTGRYNFLHRSWGPIEPFDDSAPELLKQHGVATHLVSDHYHYWEDGGATYHTRYSQWRASRGQEGDPWRGDLKLPDGPMPNPHRTRPGERTDPGRQDWINRAHLRTEADWPQAKTFAMGLEFLNANCDQDNWLLQIETFDPHEPYVAPPHYRSLYPHAWAGPLDDWPPYRRLGADERALAEHYRHESAALHTMCDHWLGRVLDFMDTHAMWDDTLLIVNTDHGFLLGEHGWWAKCAMPFYDEVAHTPLFIWDPRSGVRGQRRGALVQTIDLPATLLEFFGIDRPADMQGVPLRQTIATDQPIREAGLFGLFGGHVNVTDGRYVYMRAPVRPGNDPMFEYTLMPTQHGWARQFVPIDRLARAELVGPMPFTKGVPLLRLPPRKPVIDAHPFGTMLFDLAADPEQATPIQDRAVEGRMTGLMVELMRANAAPPEQFERLGLPA